MIDPHSQLDFPKFNWKARMAAGIAAFFLLSALAGLITWAIDNPSTYLVVGIFAGVILASCVLGVVPYLYDLTAVIVARTRKYQGVATDAITLSDTIDAARDYIADLNTDFAIKGVTDVAGTVHLVFPYGTKHGIAKGLQIQVFNELSDTLLGTVEVTDTKHTSCFAVPIDRTNARFWDGLESRMKTDFAPPVNVVGRTFRFTPSMLSDLMSMLG